MDRSQTNQLKMNKEAFVQVVFIVHLDQQIRSHAQTVFSQTPQGLPNATFVPQVIKECLALIFANSSSEPCIVYTAVSCISVTFSISF